MSAAYIVAAARTAAGRKGGRLSGWHPADLAGKVLDALVERTHADPALIDDVIMGCVSQVGEQAGNVARNAVLASKLPESVPGTTVDRQCGSSQQALHFAAQAVMSGAMDVVIAAGVESMSRVPMGLSVAAAGEERLRHAEEPEDGRALSRHPVQPVHGRRDDGGEVRPDEGRARRVRAQQPSARDRRDARAARSKPKIAAARDHAARRHARTLHRIDEGIRFDATLEAIRGVKLLQEGGRITAATSSQICDGASGVMVVNEKGLKALGVQPLARIHHMTRHRPRSGDHARSADSGDRARAEEGRHEDRRHRPVRGQRGVRVGAGRLAAAAATRIRSSSTSTAARSRSAIRSAPRAPS